MDCSDSRSEEGQGYDTDNNVKQLSPKRSKKAPSCSSKRYTGAHLYKSIFQVKLAEEVAIYQNKEGKPTLSSSQFAPKRWIVVTRERRRSKGTLSLLHQRNSEGMKNTTTLSAKDKVNNAGLIYFCDVLHAHHSDY